MYPSDVGPTSTTTLPVSRTGTTNPAIEVPDAVADNVTNDALALRYAPTLYFHPDETNFPMDPEVFLEQSVLRKDGQDEPLAGRGDLSADADGSYGQWQQLKDSVGSGNRKAADGSVYLDHDDESLGTDIRAGDPANSKLLYQYDRNTNTLSYFFFYGYNEGPQGVGDIQNHEGDWERITVQLDENDQPTEVRYSAHDGQGAVRPWSEASENGHPVVYVAKGSHASLPEPGDWKTNAYGILDEGSRDGRRFESSSLGLDAAVDVTRQDWYGSNVSWGERGRLADVDEFEITSRWSVDNPLQYETSGPSGPSASKGPILFDDQADYEAALDRQPVDPDSAESRLNDLLQSPVGDFIGSLPDAYSAAESFFTDTVPDAANFLYDAGEHFVTDTVPNLAMDAYRAGDEFVTETVPDTAVDTHLAGEEFVTETAPDAIEDGLDATGDFLGDRYGDAEDVADALIPDELPSVGVPDIDVPDDIPGVPLL